MAGLVIAGARVVTTDALVDPGWVRVEGDTITDVGTGAVPTDVSHVVDVSGALVMPGLIDIHVHGGGGFDVAESADAARESALFHRAHGTTRTLLSLAAAPSDVLAEQVRFIADLVGSGDDAPRVLGSHLEGPFLATAKCGAQNPNYFIPPDTSVTQFLLDAGRGTVRAMTVAAELGGAVDVIELLDRAGVIAAVGHTATDYHDAVAAFDAGAKLVTHLGNAMHPLHHREPGLIGAALDRRVASEVINDGHHVHPALARLVVSIDPELLVLITDAIALAGVGDGTTTLADQPVTVRDGVARTDATGSLAGSTLTMNHAVRNTVRSGIPLPLACRGAATNPARLLGIEDRHGSIAVGRCADLVVVDDAFDVQSVMVDGVWMS